MEHFCRKRAKADLVRDHLAGQGHAHHRASVEAARKRNNAASACVSPCNFYSIFNSFCASCKEDCLLRCRPWRSRVEALGELHVNVVRHDLEAGVAEALQLCAHGRNDVGVIVSGIHDRDARGEVNIAIALDIPEFGVQGPVGEDSRLGADPGRRISDADIEELFVCCHIALPWQQYINNRLRKRHEKPELGYDSRLSEEDQTCAKCCSFT